MTFENRKALFSLDIRLHLLCFSVFLPCVSSRAIRAYTLVKVKGFSPKKVCLKSCISQWRSKLYFSCFARELCSNLKVLLTKERKKGMRTILCLQFYDLTRHLYYRVTRQITYTAMGFDVDTLLTL